MPFKKVERLRDPEKVAKHRKAACTNCHRLGKWGPRCEWCGYPIAKFSPTAIPAEREIFIIYRKEEPNLPPYISISELPNRVHELEKGVYVETLDGYIVPVIKCYYKKCHFRFAATATLVLSRKKISNGISFPIFEIPKLNFHGDYKGQKISSKRQLNRNEVAFCWIMAQSWQPLEAAQTIFKVLHKQSAARIANNLLAEKRIKAGIVSAFRKQLEIAGGKESDLYLNQVLNTMKQINQVIKSVADRVREGTASESDARMWKDTLDAASRITDKNAELLGYAEQTEEFRMQISGKRSGSANNWNHILPNVQEVEVIEDAGKNGTTKKSGGNGAFIETREIEEAPA